MHSTAIHSSTDSIAAPVTDRLKYIYLASDVLLQCAKAPEFRPAFEGVMVDAFAAVAGSAGVTHTSTIIDFVPQRGGFQDAGGAGAGAGHLGRTQAL